MVFRWNLEMFKLQDVGFETRGAPFRFPIWSDFSLSFC